MAYGPDTAKVEKRIQVLLEDARARPGWHELGAINFDGLNITDLPPLPDWVWNLWLQRTTLKRITTLPVGLKHLYLQGSSIEELPDLPEGLLELDVSNTPLTRLPKLPASLRALTISGSKISVLPELPAGLRRISMSRTPITRLPPLPPSLTSLACEDTAVKDLPVALPPSLEYLYISGTQITVLPELPASVRSVHHMNTPLKIPWNQEYYMVRYTPARYNRETADIREAWLESRRPQERCEAVKEELMAAAWAPARVEKALAAGGWDALGC